MPGRVVAMETMRAEPVTNGIAHDFLKSEAHTSQPADGSHVVQKAAGGLLTNGGHIADLPQEAAAPSIVAANGAAPSKAPSLDLPDEILEILSRSFTPLSVLIERLSQECFNELSDLLGRMAEEDVTPMSNGTTNNGLVNGTGAPAGPSLRKKRLLLDFANRYREKFIKLLVLSQWSRRADDVQRLVRLKTWLDMRVQDFVQSADSIGLLKQALHSFKEPNPDIRTALETLSSGTASWIPDLGYIPAKPLSNQQMQETLKNLDALLAIRINLHEDLPSHLKQWDIANGRATFRIPAEFEFDVTIVSEDPAEPFCFLDIRFLFTPAPEIPDSQVRTALEYQSNQVLREAGLQGCFAFLRNFMLTHKIGILRRQAYAMSRSAWSGNLRVEAIRRSLIVQYWTGSQTKSWIEIGISSGTSKDGSASLQASSLDRLDMRWFRNGNEASLSGITFDWATLSMERILKQVIAKHISFILESIEHGLLLESLHASEPFEGCSVSSSPSEPGDCSLTIRIPGQRASCMLAVESVTGRFALKPHTPLSSRAEKELDGLNSPDSVGSNLLAQHLTREMQEAIERQAAHCGWRQLKNIQVPVGLAMAFNTRVLACSFFRGHGWGQVPWAIAVTVNLFGESWWAVEFADAAVGDSILSVRPVRVPRDNASQQPTTPTTLRKIEHRAVNAISIQVNAKELSNISAGCTLQQESVPASWNPSSESLSRRLTLLVEARKLLQSSAGAPPPFADGLLRLYVQTYSKSAGTVTYVCRGSLPKSSAKLLAESLSAVREDDITFANNGAFTLKISAPFGTSCIGALIRRLASLQRVQGVVTALKRHGLPITSVTLARLTFEYGNAMPPDSAATKEQVLRADIVFPSTSAFSSTTDIDDDTSLSSTSLAVAFPPRNPHRRIQAQLTRTLNLDAQRSYSSPSRSRGLQMYDTWVRTLLNTLPVLRALDAIETRELLCPASSATGMIVHARTLDTYRLTYTSKNLALDVRMRRVRDRTVWVIEPVRVPGQQSPNQRQGQQGQQQQQQQHATPPPAAVQQALRKVWGERGPSWRGLVSCIEASNTGVEDAVKAVDAAIRGAEGSAGGEEKEGDAKAKGAGAVVDLT